MTSSFNKRTPDGTEILEHDTPKRRMGTPDEKTVAFRKAREEAYEQLFGEAISVSHELLPQIPHIDVYTFKRTFERAEGNQTNHALVTGGMSDLPMTLPREAKDAP